MVNRFVRKAFSNLYKATIGPDFLTRTLTIDGREVCLQMWDTAGPGESIYLLPFGMLNTISERFQSMGVAFYRGTDAVILAADLSRTMRDSGLEAWKDEFLFQSVCLLELSCPSFFYQPNSLKGSQARRVLSFCCCGHEK